MKKFILLAVSTLILFCTTSCTSPKESQASQDTRPLEEIMVDLLTDVEVPVSSNIAIDQQNFSAFLFIDPIENAEALASEAQIGSIAHSVCILRVPDGIDAAYVAKNIETNANPRKWICVEAEKTAVLQNGNLIVLIMSFENTTNAIANNFQDMVK